MTAFKLKQKILSLVVVLLFCISGFAIAADPVTIEFQYRGDGVRTQTVEAWIAEFERENPDIKVVFVPAPDGYRDKTIISWASGIGPDVTEIWGDWAQPYARAGALMDLRPYVERDFTEADKQDFWPVAWEAAHLQFGPTAGMMFQIPRYMITTVYYYNTEHFSAAGLLNPGQLESRGEWNYDTLRDAARRLTVANEDQVTRYGFTTRTNDYRRLAVWARAFGGDFFDPYDATSFRGQDDQTVAAMQRLQDMIWVDRSTSPTYIPNDFYSGGVSIVEEGNHAVLSRFEPQIAGSFEWNLVSVPVGPNGRNSYSGDDGFAIWKNTPHPDEAWRFVKFLTSQRGQEIAAEIEGLAPVRRSAMPFYQELAPHLNLHSHFVNMTDAGLPATGFIAGDVQQIGTVLNQLLEQTLMRNERSYELAIQEAAPVIRSLMSVE